VGSFVALTAIGTIGVVPSAAQVAPDDWTSTICTSLTGWASELAERSGRFERLASTSPRRVKAELVEFLGAAVEVSEMLVDDVKGAGYPDVDNGRAIAALFTKGLTRTRVLFANAAREARRLQTSSASRFKAKAKHIERALDRGGREVENLFDSAKERYSVPELDRAFDAETACQKLSV
jgi:hypothetical protein